MLTEVQTQTRTGVELSRPALLKFLERARHVVPTRSPKPILTCMQLQVSRGLVQLRATDAELSLSTHMPAEGELQACIVPFDELRRRLKASKHPTCELSLSASGDRLFINGGCVEHALHTFDPAEFPVVPSELQGDAIEADAAELVHGLKVASYAVAKEPSRYALNGILLECDDQGSRLVATDGRRLVIVELPNAGSFGGRAILPERFCKLIEKLTDKDTDFLALAVKREQAEKGEQLTGRVFAAGPDWLLSTFECDGHFPLYREVVPRSHSKFAVERTALIETLSEVALAANEERRSVRLALDPDELRLSAEAPGVGESTATVPAEFLGGGDSCIRTAFNPAYLLDALKSLDSEQIVLDVGQNGCGRDGKPFCKPALLYARHDPMTRWVIMPVNPGLEPTHEHLGSNYPNQKENDQ